VVSERLRAGVSSAVLTEVEGVNMNVVSDGMRSSLVGVGVGVRVNSGKEVVSDTKRLLDTGVGRGVLIVKEGVKSSLVGVGVGVKVSSGNVVVSDRTKLLSTEVSSGVLNMLLMEVEGVSIKVVSLLASEKDSLLGVGVGVRVSSGKEVVSDAMKLLNTGVGDGALREKEGMSIVVSDRMTASLLEIEDRMTASLLEIESVSLGVGVRVN